MTSGQHSRGMRGPFAVVAYLPIPDRHRECSSRSGYKNGIRGRVTTSISRSRSPSLPLVHIIMWLRRIDGAIIIADDKQGRARHSIPNERHDTRLSLGSRSFTWCKSHLHTLARGGAPSLIPAIVATLSRGRGVSMPSVASLAHCTNLLAPLTPARWTRAQVGRCPGSPGAAGCPLLLLTGPGGVGKTQLALRVVADLALEFIEGVSSVGPAPIRDPTPVVTTITRALGGRQKRLPGDDLTAHDAHTPHSRS